MGRWGGNSVVALRVHSYRQAKIAIPATPVKLAFEHKICSFVKTVINYQIKAMSLQFCQRFAEHM